MTGTDPRCVKRFCIHRATLDSNGVGHSFMVRPPTAAADPRAAAFGGCRNVSAGDVDIAAVSGAAAADPRAAEASSGIDGATVDGEVSALAAFCSSANPRSVEAAGGSHGAGVDDDGSAVLAYVAAADPGTTFTAGSRDRPAADFEGSF